MQKLLFIFASIFLIQSSVNAQQKNFTYKFYGFVRGDLYYNSRNNVEAVDGNFYLYPLDKAPDATGKDMNANPNGSFYTFTTRFGLDATGPNVGSAKTTAKVEVDLGGFNLAHYTLRIRHAYVNMDWDKGSSLLLGQTWHPLFGDVMPEVLNLNTGGPFQPFNRSAQLRYQYKKNKITLTASAVYQLMYLSTGPNGKSEEYLKNGVIPELFAGITYRNNGFLGGFGIEMLSLKPRLNSTHEGKTYKVSERVTSVSLMAQAQYRADKLFLAGKTLLASNQTHTAMLGGYGVSSVDPATGEQEYTPSRHSTTWLNAVYGTNWKGNLFMGYSKNLGTTDKLVSVDRFYGSGVNIDQLLSVFAGLSYNLPHWKAGVEGSVTTAWYGDTDLSNGKVHNTHGVTNLRILGLLVYYF
ncbi:MULTISPECIES: hypothetical protein [unclassified Parabacteroides]|uniref:hypothetical protein n=1 Tax=unclassified Parabacteroides TaxID=2649774 RepID=UPI002476A9DA|nr:MULTISPECIES: hypothetical protein [unclassified Parabacteroides]